MDLLADLGEFGFTEYEGKVYLALLKDSPANGYPTATSSVNELVSPDRWYTKRSVVYIPAGRY
jgi:hypothetical protein